MSNGPYSLWTSPPNAGESPIQTFAVTPELLEAIRTMPHLTAADDERLGQFRTRRPHDWTKPTEI